MGTKMAQLEEGTGVRVISGEGSVAKGLHASVEGVYCSQGLGLGPAGVRWSPKRAAWRWTLMGVRETSGPGGWGWALGGGR